MGVLLLLLLLFLLLLLWHVLRRHKFFASGQPVDMGTARQCFLHAPRNPHTRSGHTHDIASHHIMFSFKAGLARKDQSQGVSFVGLASKGPRLSVVTKGPSRGPSLLGWHQKDPGLSGWHQRAYRKDPALLGWHQQGREMGVSLESSPSRMFRRGATADFRHGHRGFSLRTHHGSGCSPPHTQHQE